MAYENKSETSERLGRPAVVHRRAPDMATECRGSVMPQSDSNMEQGPGRAGRKAYVEPHDFTPGPQCEIGIGSRRAVNKWDGQFHDDEIPPDSPY